jgi:hypothetical protein
MGRTTWIHQCSIFDDEFDDYTPMKPSAKFIKKLEAKYNAQFMWKFGEHDDDNEIYFGHNLQPWSDTKPFSPVEGEIDDIIKQLLEVGKKYKHKFCGNFCYTDDMSGGSFSGVVYISHKSARVFQFDTDGVKPEKSHPIIRNIRLANRAVKKNTFSQNEKNCSDSEQFKGKCCICTQTVNEMHGWKCGSCKNIYCDEHNTEKFLCECDT